MQSKDRNTRHHPSLVGMLYLMIPINQHVWSQTFSLQSSVPERIHKRTKSALLAMSRNRKKSAEAITIFMFPSHRRHHVPAMRFFFNGPQVESKEVALLVLTRPIHADAELSFVFQENVPWKLTQSFRPRCPQHVVNALLKNRVIEWIELDLHANTFRVIRKQELITRTEVWSRDKQLCVSPCSIGAFLAELDPTRLTTHTAGEIEWSIAGHACFGIKHPLKRM